MNERRLLPAGILIHLCCFIVAAYVARLLWLDWEARFSSIPSSADSILAFPRVIAPVTLYLALAMGLGGPPLTGIRAWDLVIRGPLMRIMTAALLVLLSGIVWLQFTAGRLPVPALLLCLPVTAILAGSGIWLAVPRPTKNRPPHIASFVRILATLATVCGLLLASFVGIIAFSLVMLFRM